MNAINSRRPSAIPRGTHAARMKAIAQFESQRDERRAYDDQCLCFFFGGGGVRYERQRTLAIRIAAITLASDSSIIIERFRPSKVTSLVAQHPPHNYLAIVCRIMRMVSCTDMSVRNQEPRWDIAPCCGSAEHAGKAPRTQDKGVATMVSYHGAVSQWRH